MSLGHETEQVEFKKSTSELREGCESIASILNKHGAGVLNFGVRPDGEVCGQDVAESTLRQISQAVGNLIDPAVHPVIEALDDGGGRAYVRVSFEGTEAPYACKGAYRIRVADEDVLMSQGEVRRMAADAEERVRPWDGRLSGRPVEDVDEDALRDYIGRGNACGRISFAYAGVRDALERLGLMRGGMLTNAADVLFCESVYPMLKMAIFTDHRRTDIIDIQQERGTLFALARRAEFYVLSGIRRRVEFDGGMERIEIPELPMAAVREAIVNAFAHRTYHERLAVQVEIYPDAVEVFSPGWFPEGHTPEAHLSGEDRSSGGRNPLLADALYKSKDIESFATGMPRMRGLCEGQGVGLRYEKVPHGTLVVFERRDAFAGVDGDAGDEESRCAPFSVHGGRKDVMANVMANVTANDRAKGTAAKVLAEVAANPESTAAGMAEALGVSERTVRRALKTLQEQGIVERIGPDKTGFWKVVR